MGEIIPITKNDISGRRTDATHKIEDFVGVPAQSVVDTNDNYRLHIMDGSTRGGHPVAMLDSTNDFSKSISVPSLDDLAYDSEDNNTLVPNIGDTKKLIDEKSDTELKKKLDHTLEKDSVDLNDLITDGIYYVTNGTNTANLTSGMLHVYSSGTAVIQVWLECAIADPKQVNVYYRNKTIEGDSFTSWFRVLNTEDIDLENVAYINKENTFTANQTFNNDVNIVGTLSGKTIESKLDHSKSITIDDLDNLTTDGIYQISAATTNLPDEATLPCYIHVFSDSAFILQVVYSINGYVYSRAKQGDSFSQWTGGEFDFPQASLDQAGIVQLTNNISPTDEARAITPKGVYEVSQNAQTALTQSQANQIAITQLNSTVDDINTSYINTVNIPTGVLGTPTTELAVQSNSITIPMASDSSWGFTRAASKEEITSGTSNSTYLSPATISIAVAPKVEEVINDLLQDDSSGGETPTLIENITESIINNNTFKEEAASEVLDKLIEQNSLLTVKVVSSGDSGELSQDNTIYFVTE